MKRRLQVEIKPSILKDGVLENRRFLHIADPKSDFAKVQEGITKSYRRIYPTDPPIVIKNLQDGDGFDLDPDFVVEDIYEEGMRVCRLVAVIESSAHQPSHPPGSSPFSLGESTPAAKRQAPVLANQVTPAATNEFFHTADSHIPQKAQILKTPRPATQPEPLAESPTLPRPSNSTDRSVPVKGTTPVASKSRVTSGMLQRPSQTQTSSGAEVISPPSSKQVASVVPDDDIISMDVSESEDDAGVDIQPLTRGSAASKPTETMDRDEAVNMFKKNIHEQWRTTNGSPLPVPIPRKLRIDMVDAPEPDKYTGTRSTRRAADSVESVSSTDSVVSKKSGKSRTARAKQDEVATPLSKLPNSAAASAKSASVKTPSPATTLSSHSTSRRGKAPLNLVASGTSPVPKLKNPYEDKVAQLASQFRKYEELLDRHNITAKTTCARFTANDIAELDAEAYECDDGSGISDAKVVLFPRSSETEAELKPVLTNSAQNSANTSLKDVDGHSKTPTRTEGVNETSSSDAKNNSTSKAHSPKPPRAKPSHTKANPPSAPAAKPASKKVTTAKGPVNKVTKPSITAPKKGSLSGHHREESSAAPNATNHGLSMLNDFEKKKAEQRNRSQSQTPPSETSSVRMREQRMRKGLLQELQNAKSVPMTTPKATKHKLDDSSSDSDSGSDDDEVPIKRKRLIAHKPSGSLSRGQSPALTAPNVAGNQRLVLPHPEYATPQPRPRKHSVSGPASAPPRSRNTAIGRLPSLQNLTSAAGPTKPTPKPSSTSHAAQHSKSDTAPSAPAKKKNPFEDDSDDSSSSDDDDYAKESTPGDRKFLTYKQALSRKTSYEAL
ncbi:hypothetical protein DICA3_F01266 [Diutina catenulata]